VRPFERMSGTQASPAEQACVLIPRQDVSDDRPCFALLLHKLSNNETSEDTARCPEDDYGSRSCDESH